MIDLGTTPCECTDLAKHRSFEQVMAAYRRWLTRQRDIASLLAGLGYPLPPLHVYGMPSERC